jgi:hypothetical protein
LNEILGREVYTKENTHGIHQIEICSLQEFLLRKFNKDKKNGKVWFFNTEEALQLLATEF